MDIYSCYENLANAIILQAVEDYRKALKILSTHPERYSAVLEKKRIERFLRSDDFKGLTQIDGEMVLRRLRMEVISGRKRVTRSALE